MSFPDIEQPPLKKRRFFAEESSSRNQDVLFDQLPPHSTNATEGNSIDATFNLSSPSDGPVQDDVNIPSVPIPVGFKKEIFESFVGEKVSDHIIKRLREESENNMERAINMYLDGSWMKTSETARRSDNAQGPLSPSMPMRDIQVLEPIRRALSSPPTPPSRVHTMPECRYVGALGVAAWATRSGTCLVKHGEPVKIERTKIKPIVKTGKGGKAVPVLNRNAARMRTDVVVRFTNERGEEIGRLPQETASWVSTLMDQQVCRFDGTCVFIPDRVRINDTIYLQLRCSLLKKVFETGGFVKPEDNRTTGLFEEKESSAEKGLRLRQVALVKLFDEVNLDPVVIKEKTARHKRKRILQAAEIAEQYEKENDNKKQKPPLEPGSSPPASDEAEDGKELEQDQLDTLYKKAQSFDFDTPIQEPADSFTMNLRKYQKQALHWMMKKEKDEKTPNKIVSMHPLWEEYKWPIKDMDDRDVAGVPDQESFYLNPYSGELSLKFPAQEQNCLGGILADGKILCPCSTKLRLNILEMGLGKTIEMLSLMHSHKSNVAVQSEGAGLRSVGHLTRAAINSSTVEAAPCTTLVVAPMSLLAQWETEAAKASKFGTLKTMVYYGSEKAVDLKSLCSGANAASAPGLIITSYGVILSEFNQVTARGGDRGSHGGVFSLNFFRIILDEAHFIKNRQSKTAKACYELGAEHRWVLTGTPIVNRLEDLFSLVRFLRVEPWSNFSFWKTFITVPFESKDFIRALDVVQTVLEPLVLRRTKDMKTPDGKSLVPLPPRTIEIEEIELSKQEREVYDYIFNRAKRTFNATMEAGTLLKSYTTIFAQILRLRQSCCHPILTRNKTIAAEEEETIAASDVANGLADDMDLQELIERFTSDASSGDQDITNKFGAHVLQQIQSEVNNECPICTEEPMIEVAVTGCWHSACKKCLLDYIEHEKSEHRLPLCFNCRSPINARDLFEVVKESDHDSFYGVTPSPNSTPNQPPRMSLRRIGSDSSAKIVALVGHLKSIRSQSPSTKSVVFSQFTSFLDLISPALTRANIPYLRFDGAMSQKARAAVLSEFDASKSRGVVLLLSLRAGGVGLNLTTAKRVFMMDPWWSFAVEAQAIDRVHRMGQEDEVKVVRFIVAGSIEGRMLRIQERKKFMWVSLFFF